MAYSSHFGLADNLFVHMDSVFAGITDPYVQTRYTGFIAVTAVTVYELAIKEIFFDFAAKKHKVFGEFAHSHFYKINGRIKRKNLIEEHISGFGQRYVERFEKKLEKKEKATLIAAGISIKGCYGNIIQWRHDFVHSGIIPPNATYAEARKSYDYGKQVVDCLYESMNR